MTGSGNHSLTDLFAALDGRIEPMRDWAPLLQHSAETLTIGTLAARLSRSEYWGGLPGEVRELLSDILDRTAKRNRSLEEQALELTRVLNGIGVEPIVMRGMARVLAGEFAEGRLISDIDLLLPIEKRDAAIDALRGLDYEIHQGFHGPPFSVVFGRNKDVGMVDVHTSLQPYRLNVGYDRVAPLCDRKEISGARLLLPNATASVLLNVLHDQLHDGDYWRGLVDVRHMAEFPQFIEKGVDWTQLATFFPDRNARNALEVQLRTAKRLVLADIPEEYCGGTWARIQCARRLAQLRLPILMPVFTIATLAVDPPRKGPPSTHKRRSGSRLKFKFERALGSVNAGKAGGLSN